VVFTLFCLFPHVCWPTGGGAAGRGRGTCQSCPGNGKYWSFHPSGAVNMTCTTASGPAHTTSSSSMVQVSHLHPSILSHLYYCLWSCTSGAPGVRPPAPPPPPPGLPGQQPPPPPGSAAGRLYGQGGGGVASPPRPTGISREELDEQFR
jgi:hypothetical protein